MSTPQANAEKPSIGKPVMRSVVKRDDKYFETAVFWRNTNPDIKTEIFGQIDLLGNGKREHVFGFINDRKDGGGKLISLTANHTDPESGEIGFRQVAIGNVVNHRADNEPVYFDTLIFNPVDEAGKAVEGAKPVSVYVTKDCDADLHAKLGFANQRVDRPKKENTPADARSEDAEAAAEKPRAPKP